MKLSRWKKQIRYAEQVAAAFAQRPFLCRPQPDDSILSFFFCCFFSVCNNNKRVNGYHHHHMHLVLRSTQRGGSGFYIGSLDV